MSVKIRLQRKGRRKRPYYHIVVADARAPRDGRFIEKIGIYNPMTKPATIDLDREKAFDWLMKGAQPTDTMRAILKFKGVLYRKHLMRGVKRGALTVEEADAKYQEWIAAKDAKVAARFEATKQERLEKLLKLSGKVKAVAAPKATEVASKDDKPKPAETKTFAESVEQTTVESFTGEAPAKEETKEETPPAAKKEAAPKVVEEVKETAPAPEVVEETPAAPVETDDLTKVEGIGPKIGQTLKDAGFPTFAALAAADVDKLKSILSDAKLASHDPTTWPAQAKMAADGEWDKLKVWQDELDGGKVVAKKEEEE